MGNDKKFQILRSEKGSFDLEVIIVQVRDIFPGEAFPARRVHV